MDRKLGGLILVALVAAPTASAQESYRRAGSALGEAIFGSSQDAYDREYERRILLEGARQDAIRARQQADAAELQVKAIQRLQSIWSQLGLPDDEARSVASSFVWDAQMEAIRQRAARDGYQATMDAGIKAYRDYQYPLANQLVLAAYLLPVEPTP
jgi:hypothetical protein